MLFLHHNKEGHRGLISRVIKGGSHNNTNSFLPNTCANNSLQNNDSHSLYPIELNKEYVEGVARRYFQLAHVI